MINKLLGKLGLRIVRVPVIPKQVLRKYKEQFSKVQPATWDIRWQEGEHPQTRADIQCEFVVNCLSGQEEIVNIGSYRDFIIGLAANRKIITLDVREIKSGLKNELTIICDAKKIPFADNSIETVVSLCTIEHFGLGRYGDEIDLEADKKAIKEIWRILKPKGTFIFTTDFAEKKEIRFNSGRMYDYEAILEFMGEFKCLKEEIALKNNLYMGCWIK